MKHGIICGKVSGKNLNAFGTQLGSKLNYLLLNILAVNIDDVETFLSMNIDGIEYYITFNLE